MGDQRDKQLNFFEDLSLQTRQPIGNRSLVEYGIQNEVSDYRIHVGYKVQHIYVFPTCNGKRAIEEHNFIPRPVNTGGIITANGFAVPIGFIEGLQEILIPNKIYTKNVIYPELSTSSKGLLAVEIVVAMLKESLIPLPLNIDLTDDKSIQIKGTDIVVSSFLKIQVKCDYNAGRKKIGGTGNVYLQTEECNPYKFI